jgi:hypothetical protein
MPNLKLIIHPGADHGALYQYHEDFSGEVLRFLMT